LYKQDFWLLSRDRHFHLILKLAKVQQHRNSTPLSFLMPDRSPGKPDRDLAASSSDSEETAEVIRVLIKSEANRGLDGFKGRSIEDRSGADHS